MQFIFLDAPLTVYLSIPPHDQNILTHKKIVLIFSDPQNLMTPKDPNSKKILITEEDPGILDAIKIILKSEGYDLVAVTNSYSLLKKRPLPDLYLLDTCRSGERCLEALVTLKSNEITKAIPVIIMSDRPEYKDTAMGCGASAFIEKPFHIHHFKKTVSSALKQDGR